MTGRHCGILAALMLLSVGCFQTARRLPSAPTPRVGTQLHRIRVGNRDRTFLLRLPPGFTSTRLWPVLVVAHGHNSNGGTALHQSRLEDAADSAGIILVAPNGTGRFGRWFLTWHVGTCCGRAAHQRVDDVGFIAAVLDSLAAVLPIDRSRVMIAGFSAGGMLALRVACERAELVSAVANVQGTMPDTSCSPTRPVGMLLIEGTRDDDMAAEHAANLSRNANTFAISAVGTLRFWGHANGCADRMHAVSKPGYTITSADACPPSAPAELYTVEDHPHAWPGGRKTWALAQSPSRHLDATSTILQFFVRVAPPAAESR